MKKLFGLFALSLLVLSVPAAAEWPVADMNKHIDETNFVVNHNCSGTLIDVKKRLVLTAGHCVDGQYETIEVEDVDDKGVVTKKEVRRLMPGVVKQIQFDGALEVRETTYRTKLKSVDKSVDLALLEILAPIPNTVVAKLACDDPARGESLFIVGNPRGNLYSSVWTGTASSIQRSYELLNFGDVSSQQKPLMQIAGGVVGGNSGGAVYNADGRMIGVPVLAHPSNEVIGFAVPLESIKAFLKAQGLVSIYSYCASPAPLPPYSGIAGKK